ncbi:MAG: hypothetical protein M1816_003385, partial [Peltula sp. TS41687]
MYRLGGLFEKQAFRAALSAESNRQQQLWRGRQPPATLDPIVSSHHHRCLGCNNASLKVDPLSKPGCCNVRGTDMPALATDPPPLYGDDDDDDDDDEDPDDFDTAAIL